MNMLYAYGGADLNLSGTAIIRQSGSLVISRRWSGDFEVSLGDLYSSCCGKAILQANKKCMIVVLRVLLSEWLV
jgi:hypothetical protein